MALKYFFEYTDLDNILHRIEINDPDYESTPIEITGFCSLESGNVNSPIEAIRGTGLKIYLDASVDLTFSDLYSENDRNFKVTYIRNSQVEFVGFLNPEGLYENYVSDRWVINLICADGLSFLKNLSFVDNETGDRFEGRQSELEIISNCLKRTDLSLNINTSVAINYTGQEENTDVFTQVYSNVERFLKEDNQDTVENCDKALRSVIEKYNAVINFYRGEWYIFRPIELFQTGELEFFSYDSDGVFIERKTVDFSIQLGSQINNFAVHWANANQQKKIKNSIGAYRINYKYGLVRNILLNPTLLNQGTGFQNPSDFEVFDWNVLAPLYIGFNSDNPGVGIAVTNATSTVLVLESDPITVSQNESFSFSFTQKSLNESAGIPPFLPNNRIAYRVKLTDGITDYYLQPDGLWTTAVTAIDIDTVFIGFTTTIIDSDTLPIDGDLTVIIQDARDAGFVYITLIDIRSITNIQGENHTFEKAINPSTKIQPTKQVFTGDIASDAYLGTLYQSDSETPTLTWYRKGIEEEKPILRIMGEDTMGMFQNPSIEFQGDIFNFISYLSRITIDNQDGVYIPIEYNYNISTNTTKLKLRQIYGNLTEINYSFGYDYGNVVDPTIQG